MKGLEWVTAIYLSQDPVGIKEIIANTDQHQDNQDRFHLPSRLVAKTFVFRLIYGGSAWSYAHDPAFASVKGSEKFWQNVIDDFYSKYRGLHKWHTAIVQEVVGSGRLVMPTGRVYTYTKDHRGEWPRTTILNYPVQGLGADLMMIGRISFYRRLKASNLTGLLVSSIHDSLVVDCLDNDGTVCYNICKILKESIEDIPKNFERLFGVSFNLPMRCEISIGPNKKDMEIWNG